MEVEYSPSHHSPTNTIHLLTPSHAHAGIEAFASIRQLRRTLSRSPSKSPRFLLRTCNTSPTTPQSPSLLGKSGQSPPDARPRPSAKRTVPTRAAGRRISPNSPLRRALSDNSNQGNILPRAIRRSSYDEQENMEYQEEPRSSDEFASLKTRSDVLLHPMFNTAPKSSPLKRSDGVMNLEAATTTSPRVKRRSTQAAHYSNDANVFDYGVDSNASILDENTRSLEQMQPYPTLNPNSPQRRPFSLRKSTLQQRNVSGRTRLFGDVLAEGHLSPALSRARSRISLDSALQAHRPVVESPSRRNSADMQPPVTFVPPGQRLYQSAPKPHPLSHALTPSSSSSSVTEESAKQPLIPPAPHLPSTFSRSLPIGSIRPSPAGEGSFATPAGYKMAKPLPQAFMSTGLISKRNRNIDSPSVVTTGPMPDTPSKKTHAHVLPLPKGIGSFSIAPIQDFDNPSTPFHCRVSDFSPETYRNGNIFGVPAPDPSQRRGSFFGLPDDEQSQSPSRGTEGSQDDLPPTPTKPSHSGTRPASRGKSNSLRSSLFGRRTSLNADTFVPPAAQSQSPEQQTSILLQASDAQHNTPHKHSPHTPSDSIAAPDASKLSISAERNQSLFPSNSFPPATPTGPRDQPFKVSLGIGQHYSSSGYFANEVDTSLSSRFTNVTSYGLGEFSQVYKVEGAVQQRSPSEPTHMVWAVKKSRKPYAGIKDRERKMKEVRILQQLRGNEHVVEFVDHWEAKSHLYIQTQFCENGNLRDFLLQTGYKGRLDDFRIWKILLELGQGVKSIHDNNIIHLDIKPANVFIDWEGVLKIGDFGLASTWPAPTGIDGEGDREYIGPEVLSGRFDKPGDIFSLGMVMLEIAGNIVLPDNGKSWQRLRAGDMSDLPSLTWSSDSSLARDGSGEPIEASGAAGSTMSLFDNDLSFLNNAAPMVTQRSQELVVPPNFMIDARDPEALELLVQWMICPDPDQRPTVHQLLAAGGVQWVERRRRAGATIYEGCWGPADAVLDHEQDVEMVDI